MSRVAIIALEYLEKSYQETVKCIEATGLPVYWAKRDGIGSMSRAWNDCYEKYRSELQEFDYLLFVTNITFAPDLPMKLAKAMDDYPAAACVPEYMSDHLHIRPDGSADIKVIPFVEFTVCMVRRSVFDQVRFDENFWFYYFDLQFSKELRDRGWQMFCHHGAKIGHTYLRNSEDKEQVSRLRERVRDTWRVPVEQKLLEQRYGSDWRKVLVWNG